MTNVIEKEQIEVQDAINNILEKSKKNNNKVSIIVVKHDENHTLNDDDLKDIFVGKQLDNINNCDVVGIINVYQIKDEQLLNQIKSILNF